MSNDPKSKQTPPRPTTQPSKLGKIDNQATTSGNPFKMRRRLPGWHPDRGNDDAYPENLFLEEALKWDANGIYSLPVPKSKSGSGKDIPFREPKVIHQWPEFNKWILGHGVPKETSTEHALTTLIRKLTQMVRNYNASLYRLRRLHLAKYHPTNPREAPKNPFGDKDIDPASLDADIVRAECNWIRLTERIMLFLDRPHTYNKVTINNFITDMVEVNGYIVSMRVIEIKYVTALGSFELGGSSSHVSISSAFSSSLWP
jgi:hypothetical protein